MGTFVISLSVQTSSNAVPVKRDLSASASVLGEGEKYYPVNLALYRRK